ncbi:hypothetical protein M758_9G126200 [Ceratodon purpureus]|nr:hypothetical protein M758_9G126200 [Ceratodon purpureus]
MAVMLKTSVGELVIDLFTDQCPLATKNFLKLCKIKYYNNCLFHSVQKDFIVQTGDPTGTGKGGDSIYKLLYGDQARFFDDEIHPTLKHDKVGIVAMASAGENVNASQFYITTRAELDYLDEKHTVFGEIAEGLDTLTRINETFVDENFRPYKNIRIKHAIIIDDPFDDPAGLAELIPDKSPELKPPAEGEEVRLEDDWVAMDETMDPEEIEKSLRKKEAQSRAVVLEMIGDLPEADMKPPENVLFVCKLNPVTEDGDLELIFGRFGKVKSADIIRDFKTGDSLCYAFIEFETPESCEAAYFKMDNVLIDDRRIHVDFSQSVSHLWNRYRKVGKNGGDGQPGNHGKGCFKCGEVGHFAKECPNDGADQKESPTEKPKYTIKDTGGQRGNANKRYEMVFDEDEAPQKQEVVVKERSRSQAGEMEQERRVRDREGRSRQDRRHDKDRDVDRREHETRHYSQNDRGIERPRADRETERPRVDREIERPRADRYRDRSAERVSNRSRVETDTDRDRSAERVSDRSRVERDTGRSRDDRYGDRRTQRVSERSRVERDTGRSRDRDTSRAARESGDSDVDRDIDKRKDSRGERSQEPRNSVAYNGSKREDRYARNQTRSPRREQEISREHIREGKNSGRSYHDTNADERKERKRYNEGDRGRDREQDGSRYRSGDYGGREKRSRQNGD